MNWPAVLCFLTREQNLASAQDAGISVEELLANVPHLAFDGSRARPRLLALRIAC
jgi:hypothetical protein